MYQEPGESSVILYGGMRYDRGIIMKHSCCLTTDLDWYSTNRDTEAVNPPTQRASKLKHASSNPICQQQRRARISGSRRQTERSNGSRRRAGRLCTQEHVPAQAQARRSAQLVSDVLWTVSVTYSNKTSQPDEPCIQTFLALVSLSPFCHRGLNSSNGEKRWYIFHCTSQLYVGSQA